MSRFAERFRTVVAMWIFVGFAGCLLFGAFGVMAVTGSGVFHEMTRFTVDSEFEPGVEVPTDDVRPGDFLVLANPATVDLSTVECTGKSRVYSTGEQVVEPVAIKAPQGAAAVMRSSEPAPRPFTPVAVVDWMGTDFISCTGAGVESFALTSAKGINTDGYRYTVGAFLLVLSPVMAGLGYLALHMTRTWSRQAAMAAYQYPQGQYPHVGVPQAQQPRTAPGSDPYAPPPEGS